MGRRDLADAYGIVKDGEVFLLNLHIAPYEQGHQFNHEPTRTRKLSASQEGDPSADRRRGTTGSHPGAARHVLQARPRQDRGWSRLAGKSCTTSGRTSASSRTSVKWRGRPAPGDSRPRPRLALRSSPSQRRRRRPPARSPFVCSDRAHVRPYTVVARADGQTWRQRRPLRRLRSAVRCIVCRTGHSPWQSPVPRWRSQTRAGSRRPRPVSIPLPATAWVDGPTLYLPLAVVADVLPRVASGVSTTPKKPKYASSRAACCRVRPLTRCPTIQWRQTCGSLFRHGCPRLVD